jgi:hypothetical protein
MKKSKKISISIPEKAADIFNWISKYDLKFKNKSHKEIAEAFLAKGLLDAYQEQFVRDEDADSDSILPHHRYITGRISVNPEAALQSSLNELGNGTVLPPEAAKKFKKAIQEDEKRKKNKNKFKFDDGGLLKEIRATASPLDPEFIKKATAAARESYEKMKKEPKSILAKLSKKKIQKLLGK